jgi:hypothetical protein
MFEKLINTNTIIVISLCLALFIIPDIEITKLLISGLLGFVSGGILNNGNNK